MESPPLAALLAPLRLGLRRAAQARTAVPGDTARLLAALAEALERDGAGLEPAAQEAALATLELLAAEDMELLAGDGLELDPLARVGSGLAAALRGAPAGPEHPLRRAAWAWLDVARRPPVPRLVAGARRVESWWPVVLEVIDASEFTFGRLFAQRVESLGPRTLFRVPARGSADRLTWHEVAATVDRVARGLLALLDEAPPGPVAIVSENRPEMALVDLACLTTGLVTVMIPPGSTEEDVLHALAESGATVAVVSSETQLAKLARARAPVGRLAAVVMLDPPPPELPGVTSFPELVARGRLVTMGRLARVRDAVRLADLATVMYTSGTTGQPKGIRFSGRNIVTKRFARALALPALGESDLFLAYLPLCHTFGRFFEMCGAIYWGATYVFQESPALDALVRNFQRFEPTVFISIPKKWTELYDEIARKVDLETAPADAVRAACRSVVGGRLAFGLSAAGYLAPSVFRFFQAQGVELMSGFGMTEATGGITMTPPGEYRDDSLGRPLPGIEAELSPEGELRIRGPYVTIGYAGDGGSGLDGDGWLATGDLLARDDEGHFRFVDRKKEIYKNLRGETVTPQRIENMFREFETVRRVFLVGDHREYNTALIVPEAGAAETDLRAMTPAERRSHFRALVFSVNRFLAAHERILDFALLDRDFSEEAGELTPKQTFRRSVVAQRHAATIDALYRRALLRVPGLEARVRVPNWLLQASGLIAEDFELDGNLLRVPAHGVELAIAGLGRSGDAERVRVGDGEYLVRGRVLDLGRLAGTLALWLGNGALLRFLAIDPAQRVRFRRPGGDIERAPDEPVPPALPFPAEPADEPAALVLQVSHASSALLGPDAERARAAIAFLSLVLERRERAPVEAALLALRRAAFGAAPAVRHEAMCALLPAEQDDEVAETLSRFAAGAVLEPGDVERLAGTALSDAKLRAVIQLAVAKAAERDGEAAGPWLDLLAAHGATRPGRFRTLRAALARVAAFGASPAARERGAAALERLVEGFRDWLGGPMKVAVDPETDEEYGWPEVLRFDGSVPEEDRPRLAAALSTTCLLREAIFLLGGGHVIRLSEIPPGGVMLSLLGDRHGKRVYRVRVETRLHGPVDVALNLAYAMTPEEVREEVLWLTVAGEEHDGERLVEGVGGSFERHGMFTEEFVAGETLERLVERLARGETEEARERLRQLWPFLAWSACRAYLDFWHRTGHRFVAGRPFPGGVIAPSHDYQSGPRIVSLGTRQPFAGLGPLLASIWDGIVGTIERAHPELAGLAPRELSFGALLEALGIEAGLAQLEQAASTDAELAPAIGRYAAEVREHGFVPRRLQLAVDRYRRWATRAGAPTREARAATLAELWQTYRLPRLLAEHPDARLRFFRETVFAGSAEPLRRALEELGAEVLRRAVEGDALVERVRALRAVVESGSEDEYFLARLTYPHLQPEAAAVFVSTGVGGARRADVVVTLSDQSGRRFQVRPPVSPREVSRLHRLFLDARLPVSFGPEHDFLVAVGERGEPVGGLFFDHDPDARTAHLDKIVVSEACRGQGVGEGLMKEFMDRLKGAGVTRLTTGYFRPEFFRRFGFAVDQQLGGLVRPL
ncbi:MAG: GNAT family N-acetyltransferase [Acidobacteria bacterium]|jgi:long-subunit acyl-CoA synthetase (AMP-forming)/GNAT superfamily N-acetyltransferase|nr:GNAT family N-acetyltransferase [Acidobacteriota bacterium]